MSRPDLDKEIKKDKILSVLGIVFIACCVFSLYTIDANAARKQPMTCENANPGYYKKHCTEPTPLPPEPITTMIVYITWDHPTQRVDGSPLSILDIAGYQIKYITVDIQATVYIPVVNNFAIEVPIDSVVLMATVDTNGLVSDWAGEGY